MKFFQIVILLTLAFAANGQCKVDPGKLGFVKNGNEYRFFMERKPSKTCFPVPDSASVRIGFGCMSGAFESYRMGVNDTLAYYLTGNVIISVSTYWWRNGVYQGRTDIANTPYIQAGGSCGFDFVEISTQNPPPPPVLPPPAPLSPNLWVNNWLLESNSAGTLIVLSSPYLAVHHVKTYSGPFSYQLESGTWWVQAVWPDGSFSPLTEYIAP